MASDIRICSFSVSLPSSVRKGQPFFSCGESDQHDSPAPKQTHMITYARGRGVISYAKIQLVGGDKRQLELCSLLKKKGYHVG